MSSNSAFLVSSDLKQRVVNSVARSYPKIIKFADSKKYNLFLTKKPLEGEVICRKKFIDDPKDKFYFYVADQRDVDNPHNYEFVVVRPAEEEDESPVDESEQVGGEGEQVEGVEKTSIRQDNFYIRKHEISKTHNVVALKLDDGIPLKIDVIHKRAYIPYLNVSIKDEIQSKTDSNTSTISLGKVKYLTFYLHLLNFIGEDAVAFIAYCNNLFAVPVLVLKDKGSVVNGSGAGIKSEIEVPVSVIEKYLIK